MMRSRQMFTDSSSVGRTNPNGLLASSINTSHLDWRWSRVPSTRMKRHPHPGCHKCVPHVHCEETSRCGCGSVRHDTTCDIGATWFDEKYLNPIWGSEVDIG